MQSNGTYSSILELQKILQFPWRYHIIIPFIWSEMYMICHLNRYCSYYFWLLHNLNMDSKNLPWKTSITKSWLNFSHVLFYSVKTMYFLTFFTFWTRTAIFMSISILFNFIASYYNLLFANNYLCLFFSTDSIIKESHFANFPNSDSNVKKWTFWFYKGIDNNWKFR